MSSSSPRCYKIEIHTLTPHQLCSIIWTGQLALSLLSCQPISQLNKLASCIQRALVKGHTPTFIENQHHHHPRAADALAVVIWVDNSRERSK